MMPIPRNKSALKDSGQVKNQIRKQQQLPKGERSKQEEVAVHYWNVVGLTIFKDTLFQKMDAMPRQKLPLI